MSSSFFMFKRKPVKGAYCVKRSAIHNPAQGWYAMVARPKDELSETDGRQHYYWGYIDQQCYLTKKFAKKVVDFHRQECSIAS